MQYNSGALVECSKRYLNELSKTELASKREQDIVVKLNGTYYHLLSHRQERVEVEAEDFSYFRVVTDGVFEFELVHKTNVHFIEMLEAHLMDIA